MIKGILDRYLKRVFKAFNLLFDDYNLVLKEHAKELKKIKEVLERPDGLMTMTGVSMVCGSYNTKEETLELLDDTLKKCYFTKEFINESATNTKELFVIEGDNMKKVVYKEGNETKEVKTIKGKKYLF